MKVIMQCNWKDEGGLFNAYCRLREVQDNHGNDYFDITLIDAFDDATDVVYYERCRELRTAVSILIAKGIINGIDDLKEAGERELSDAERSAWLEACI